MTQHNVIQQFLRYICQPSIYLFGGLIFILWLLVTPSGIYGKSSAVGYAVCHQIDVRSFHIGVRQLPLCVRCTGQYLGAVIGLGFLTIFGRRRTGTPPRRVIGILILLIVIDGIDGLNSYFSLPPFLELFPDIPRLYEPSNVFRLFTGTGMGLVIAMLLYPAFWGSIHTNPDPQPVIIDLKTLMVIIGLGILVDLLILTGSKYILIPAAFISTGGVLLLLTTVYTILWMRIRHKENQFRNLSQIIPYTIIGFLITMTQIALFDLIRYIITGSWNGLIFG